MLILCFFPFHSILLIKIIISSGLGTFIALSFWIVGYAHIEHPPIASLLGQTSVIFITVLSVVFVLRGNSRYFLNA